MPPTRRRALGRSGREVAAFLQGLLLVAAFAATACAVARWVVPIVLRSAVDVLDELVVAVAGLALLPEYWLSSQIRAHGRCPPRLAYEFGRVVAVLACQAQQVLRRLCLGFAKAATAVHPGIVATIAGGFTGAELFAWGIW